MGIDDEIKRNREIMGLPPRSIFNSDKCLPRDYYPGKKYGRDDLSKMFVCYTGKPNKFPLLIVKNWLFPPLPGGGFNSQDPKNMSDGRSIFTIKQMADMEDRNTRNITVRVSNLDIKNFDTRILSWFEKKKQGMEYNKRINYQMNKIRANNMDTLSVTPKDEPIILESISKTLRIIEGWHRIMAIFEMIKNKELSQENVNILVATIYRSDSFDPRIVEKPLGLFE